MSVLKVRKYSPIKPQNHDTLLRMPTLLNITENIVLIAMIVRLLRVISR